MIITHGVFFLLFGVCAIYSVVCLLEELLKWQLDVITEEGLAALTLYPHKAWRHRLRKGIVPKECNHGANHHRSTQKKDTQVLIFLCHRDKLLHVYIIKTAGPTIGSTLFKHMGKILFNIFSPSKYLINCCIVKSIITENEKYQHSNLFFFIFLLSIDSSHAGQVIFPKSYFRNKKM